MKFLDCINNFPWNRFATVYDTNSKGLKDKFLKIWDGKAEPQDYKYIIDRLEHQETLYRITPWGLKFYISLLGHEKANKKILLQNIKTLFEAANYNSQVDIAMKYKPTKGNLGKYEIIKPLLFDNKFDGIMDAEYLKAFKSIDRNFMQISIMEYILKEKQLFERFIESDDKDVSKNAIALINSINDPKKYQFRD